MKIISINCCSLCKHHKKDHFGDLRCKKSLELKKPMDTCEKFEKDKFSGIFKIGDHA